MRKLFMPLFLTATCCAQLSLAPTARADAFTQFILQQDKEKSRKSNTARQNIPTIATIQEFVLDLQNSYRAISEDDFDVYNRVHIDKDGVNMDLSEKSFIGLGVGAEATFTTHDNYKVDMKGVDDSAWAVSIRGGVRF